ncbi:multidrug efflux RND transporter outer membrane subunit SmeF [Stenotrophomonas maltophilia]|nr:multidrug efflux RND transporter outer membrane subunit SmeF [Stenotrophomonas maltophilia]
MEVIPMKSASLFLSIAAVLALAGCSTLVPKNTAVAPAIPAQWPAEAAQGEVADVAAVGWRDFFTDARLQQVIDQTLQNNRDLRVAVLNVERARGQYRVQRADRVPGVAVTGQMQRQGTDAGVNEQFTAGVGVAEFELDLFGRVRNLSEAALQQYFAVAANRRNAQLSLVAETATAWLTYGADAQRLKIADATLKTYEDSLRLAEARHERGGSSALELTQTRTLVETARTDAARLRGQLAQDRNALALLAGGQLDPALLPDSIEPQLLALAPPPAGLPSDVLLQRPDIMAAEHQLLAANANIGAARAAFFPSISLTGSIGSGSSELSNLFDSGTRVWSFLPKITLPIFQGGKLRANLAIANADRDIALAQYEKSIQVGFRETADALALNVSLDEQVSSQQRLVEAAEQANRLSQARYDAGLDSFVTLLDARRTAYNAQQTQLQAQLAQQATRITLYKVMGGGWHERS